MRTDPIILRCDQGTVEWHDARMGIPTSSQFGSIITPLGKPCKPEKVETYMMKLLAEWLSGEHEEGFSSKYMERGYLTQPEAIDFYQLQRGVDVEQIGFVYKNHDRLTGSSTDGLPPEGVVELKCPSGGVHIRFLREPVMPRIYIPQVQGSLWVTGRPWCDFVSYHATMPSALVRIYPDKDYHAMLDDRIGIFINTMLQERANLKDRGYTPVVRPAAEREQEVMEEA